jgi:lactate dehydrogenase-like 2-hydroxyacid dehydrogenase
MRETVLVTQQEFDKAAGLFQAAVDVSCEPAPAEEAALAAAVTARGARAVIVGVAPYRGPLYAALGRPGGALLARFGVGHDGIDKELARRHGIIVTNTPSVLDLSVAEHTLWLMGCLARNIAQGHEGMRAGKFAGQAGMELHGKTLGILGFGNIGRRVAGMAHFGLGMNVLALVRGPQDCRVDGLAALAASGAVRYAQTVEELFRQSDILSIHLPANAGTQRFVNAERLGWLQPGALLINTARGAVLDEVALFDALAAGRLAGAALDVFAVEPYQPEQPDKDLRRLDNVVLTPHIGSNTREANGRMAAAALKNVRDFCAGRLDQLARVDLPAAAKT